MKKIFLLLFAAACAFASWAESTVSATVKGDKLEVALTNDAQSFVAFQMDITLPDGVDVAASNAVVMNKARLTEKEGNPVAGATDANFIIAYNQIDEHTVRVLAYNLENRAIAGTSGELFTMTFTGTATADFDVTGIKFVTKTALAEIDIDAIKSSAGSVDVGNVNREGGVDINDLLALVDILSYGPTAPECAGYDLDAANVNGEDGIDINDLVALIEML